MRVLVFDDRQEWLDKIVNGPLIHKIYSEDLPSEVNGLPVGSTLLSITKGHAFDVPILKEAFAREEKFPFIGVIGSNAKKMVINKELHELGVKQASLERLVCPIGLDIGDNTPAQIAISITAQLMKHP